jgi:glycosidase
MFINDFDYEYEAKITLERLWPRLTGCLNNTDERLEFKKRLETHFPRLFRLLHSLYGQQYDFFYHLEQILSMAATMFTVRSNELKILDRERERNPNWFQSEQMIGGVCYVDKFAIDLKGVMARIPYFKELGLTYLYLMPLYRVPEGENDNGFAVSSYRDVAPALGDKDDLRQLAFELRQNGISLVLDFVFNHTSDEHEWALKALDGEVAYQNYYLMFDDRTLPDQYERTLREIFPEQAPGSFTYHSKIDKWVWTTFNRYQWDLNYTNPEVFTSMLAEMLYIANLGTEVLRLDAVAFVWKQMGTTCEGLPQAHVIVQAFNTLKCIAAPAMVFKSEAIVHPVEVATYIGQHEAPIAYNPTLMALLWEALATRQVKLLQYSMQHHFNLPENCSWVNYVRCHDDIGWTFADEDAAILGINGFDHRQFLNQFYTGLFDGSFARGLPFNYNEITQDMRISGMCASLAGLEQALELENPMYREHALRRIELIHAIIMSIGGIPLIYLGDELGMLNDYGYQNDPDHANDSRFVHRPKFDWQLVDKRSNPDTVVGRIFGTLTQFISIRKSMPVFANGNTEFFDTGNAHVFGFSRSRSLFVYANFSEKPQIIHPYQLGGDTVDLICGQSYREGKQFQLKPYQIVWLSTN